MTVRRTKCVRAKELGNEPMWYKWMEFLEPELNKYPTISDTHPLKGLDMVGYKIEKHWLDRVNDVSKNTCDKQPAAPIISKMLGNLKKTM